MHGKTNVYVVYASAVVTYLPELLSKKAAALVWVLKVPMVRSRGPMGIAHGRIQRPATIVGLGAQTARRSALGARRSALGARCSTERRTSVHHPVGRDRDLHAVQ